MSGRSTLVRLVGVAMLRPRLAFLMARTAWRFRSKDWYRRPPFLPVPPPEYLAWRSETAWGDAEHVTEPAALERYLRWVRWMKPANEQ